MPQFLFFCHPQKVRKRRGECHWTHLLCANKRCDEMVREIFIHAEVRSRERGHSTTMWTKFYIQFTPCLVTPVDFLVNPHPPLLVHVVIACPHTKIKKAKLFSKIDSSWSIFRTILCLFFREGDAIYYAF